MQVLQCGTLVKTKLSKIEAMITAITIRFGKVVYEVSYFDELKYTTAWLAKEEFEVSMKAKTTTIGFVKN